MLEASLIVIFGKPRYSPNVIASSSVAFLVGGTFWKVRVPAIVKRLSFKF